MQKIANLESKIVSMFWITNTSVQQNQETPFAMMGILKKINLLQPVRAQ